ncbi:HNH endonuclease domain-containing protein [Dapis sp. BLCC M172]|uniref:HNH endonuclease domain-containing protein n=1 Tax=Dapis sp. BLCC M172 TaxID=2975281 RepID=UPI003CEEC77F
MGLIVCEGSKDFLTGQPVEINKCQDDHIFPKSIHSEKYDNLVDSILNRTLIYQTTNRCKSNKLPADFLNDCLAKHGGNEEQL